LIHSSRNPSECNKISIANDVTQKYWSLGQKVNKRAKNLALLVRMCKNLCMCDPLMETNLICPFIDRTYMELSFELLKFLEVSINGYLWKGLPLLQPSNLF
jgi:hypothetical protein